MRIDSSNGPTSNQADVATCVTSTGSTERITSFAAPLIELTRLLEALKQMPDVRTTVVDEIRTRIAAGELSTQNAAREAADALYNSQDG